MKTSSLSLWPGLQEQIEQRKGKIGRHINDLIEEGIPHEDFLFTAYDNLSPQDVKVIFIGQDPYPNPRFKPDGLCFSANQVTASLIKMNEALDKQLGKKISNTRLLHWRQQGILLLNACLTVKPFEPGSHENKGWEEFIASTIDTILFTSQPVFIWSMGSRASRIIKPFVGKDNVGGLYTSMGNKYFFTSEHPASAARNNRAWRTQGFIKLNEFLKQNYPDETEIKW